MISLRKNIAPSVTITEVLMATLNNCGNIQGVKCLNVRANTNRNDFQTEARHFNLFGLKLRDCACQRNLQNQWFSDQNPSDIIKIQDDRDTGQITVAIDNSKWDNSKLDLIAESFDVTLSPPIVKPSITVDADDLPLPRMNAYRHSIKVYDQAIRIKGQGLPKFDPVFLEQFKRKVETDFEYVQSPIFMEDDVPVMEFRPVYQEGLDRYDYPYVEIVTRIIRCENNHTLVKKSYEERRKEENSLGNKSWCDVCGYDLANENSYHCQECQYDLCQDCHECQEYNCQNCLQSHCGKCRNDTVYIQGYDYEE